MTTFNNIVKTKTCGRGKLSNRVVESEITYDFSGLTEENMKRLIMEKTSINVKIQTQIRDAMEKENWDANDFRKITIKPENYIGKARKSAVDKITSAIDVSLSESDVEELIAKLTAKRDGKIA